MTTIESELGPPDGPDQSEADAARARKEDIGRVVAMFVLPFIMVSMMITGYLAAMHAPAPHDMPIAVAGNAQLAEDFARSLQSDNPDAVDVRIVADDATARELVLSREVAGAVTVQNSAASVYTAGAAGASQASSVSELVVPEVLAQNLDLTIEDLAALPNNDMAGLAAMFMTTALMLAGYMPLSIMLSNSPELLRKRKVFPLLAGWSALIAVLVWFVAGPVLGAVEGNAGVILGISWLAVFAVGSVQLFLTRIFGPMAVLVGMLLLMVLGVPASNMGMSVYMMPSLYGWLHSFLPAAATGEALRSVQYFDGDGVGIHIFVLAIGAAIAIALTFSVDAVKRRRNPDNIDPEVTLESLTAGPRPKSDAVRYLTLASFPLAMVVLMFSVMLGAMYQPAPRDLPVAVVASTTEQAQQAVDGLEENLAGMFDLRAYDSADRATDDVRDRTVVGAYVLPSETSPNAVLVTSEAAGVSQMQVVDSVFGEIASGQQVPLVIQDVTPLPGSDSMGTVTLYMAMGWILAGFMIIVVGSSAAPKVMGLKTLLPIVAGWSVFMSAVVWLIADPIVGAIDGHFLQLMCAGIVAIFATAMFTTVFVRLLGLLAVIPAVAILMFVGVPASNGAMSIFMTPSVFQFLHGILPMPAAVETIRSILYFGGDTVGEHLIVLVIWGVLSLACVVTIDAFRRKKNSDRLNGPVESDTVSVQ
ncbi:ABC transporter permease [Rhodococcus sp. P1Y]|uniref:ABC transporter permease n=1 Tax=Rhodococcus sp. P1Y TaxID=1302308 RepID=UPI000EAB6E3C|nr:ABC transporter permease [Rhodococcus sp. P1Y]AYJ50383.1 ABC transporter permease [Rhodococcus sp. P1Y]